MATKNPVLAATSSGAILGERDATEYRKKPAELQGLRGPSAGSIRKNAAEEIRIELTEFNGHQLINIRVWTEPRNGGSERIPTKAGIACRVALLPEIIDALQQAEARARARGLL
jgi:transcriptional coactivator p15 (PC4)